MEIRTYAECVINKLYRNQLITQTGELVVNLAPPDEPRDDQYEGNSQHSPDRSLRSAGRPASGIVEYFPLSPPLRPVPELFVWLRIVL
jgi:hypothetical protein